MINEERFNTCVRVKDDSGDSTITYVGIAPVGSLSSSAVWQVMKLVDAAEFSQLFADGNAKFDNIWDNREALTYE